ncbi:hypothetical protein DEU56DRAFT_977227 [Suillus clintonianus]|uniref:uncharacterized protein n=1 Tax=Suillus clintonianus TaxID=1904413 RepID=UPI001B8871F3|nr:uncharacterized protein DEU56DRAFT_977227 [Suillus clintonianus]KAG2152842.1 hypothetical protein DEU56DRAFT_977227 [Suillus clintonianus]
MNDVIDLIQPPIFNPHEWIGKGKIYDKNTLPMSVLNARSDALVIPSTHTQHIPSHHLPVADFLKISLPTRSPTIVAVKIKCWFSHDLPDRDFSYLNTRPIPSAEFLSAWRTSEAWLAKALLMTGEAPDMTAHVQDMFLAVLWNSKGGGSTSTLEFTHLLGMGWITDELIDSMMAHLAHRAHAQSHGRRILIENSRLAEVIKGLTISGNMHPLLSKCQEKIITLHYELLLFPVHVHGNHWVAVAVDFNKKNIAIGDSLRGQIPPPDEFARQVQQWLLRVFNAHFSINNEGLTCASQNDTYSCGVVSTNAIAHTVFGDELWQPKAKSVARATWFVILARDWLSNVRMYFAICFKCHTDMIMFAKCEIRKSINGGEVDKKNSLSFILNNPSSCAPPILATSSTSTLASTIEPVVNHSSVDLSATTGDSKIEVPKQSLLNWLSHVPKVGGKRTRSKTDFVGTENKVVEVVKKARLGEESFGPVGISQSATASRGLRAAARSGEFKPCPKKKATWKKKIRELDSDAVAEDDCQTVRHSICGRTIKVKEPYDVSRFREHATKKCAHQKSTPAAGMPTVTQWTEKFDIQMKNNNTSKTSLNSTLSTPSLPCPGISSQVEPLIENYLYRSAVPGGGSKSVVEIANELFSKTFGKLSKMRKQIVMDKQSQGWKWKNDHQRIRVYSTQCEKVVKTIKRPIPKDKNFIHINHRFRSAALAMIYARTIGVREILETAAGKYTDLNVFTGLVEAMVTKLDREERGVGMQNFKYSPSWDEFSNVLRIHSPQALRFLSKHLPLVADHLADLSYRGPTSLCCDNTKLYSAWRIFWDAEKEAHYLIGGIGEPYLVANLDALREIIKEAKLTLATKMRLWCLQVPLPKIAPIIVAALPLASDHNAESLAKWSLEIIGGLRRHQIPIVSYACDGTEVERAVQRIVVRDADSVIVYGIESPFAGMSAIRLEIPVHHGQALVNIQDPKHGLKMFHNNLFSGARLLILGNYTALFAHIRAMAFEDGTPLYHWDVEKLDRQDNNAAARLFSSATLKFLVEHHPDHVGEIVFLFIHGEIVDAYQHWSISHCERVKMVLQARYFYDGWRLYLAKIGYKENKYFMSRESTDIVMRLIDGLILLVIVYRDYLPDDHPLLPWLHTSEPCEHSFANLRNIKKDFVMLDAYYAIPKLHAKLQEEVLRQRSPDFKAHAQGYTITYFYDHTVDIPELSQYPSDTDIQEASQDAAHEAQSLLALCGISPGLLMQTQSIVLPSIVHFDGGMDISDSDNGGDESENESVVDRDADAEEQCEAQLLNTLMKLAEDDDISRTEKQRNKLLQLTFAAIALDTDEQQCIRKFAEDEDEDDTEICAHEFAQIEHCLSLPTVRLADNLSKPMGLGTFPIQALDIDALVRIRSNHETEQVKKGICTGRAQLNDIAGNVLSERRRLIREFQVVLKEQQGRAIGTGLEHAAHWTEQVPQAGNSANAANAAKAVVKRAMLRRKSVFKTARLPLLAILNDAHITLLRPLKDGDFGIVFTEQWGLRVGRVVAIYSKGGGKNGKHGAVESVDAIAAISYLGVQLYQQHFRQYFRSLPDATSIFQCRQFVFLPSTAFLCLLTSAPKVTPSGLELVPADVSAFETLHHASPRLTEAAKLFRKRVVNQTVLQADHDEGEEEY